MRLVVVLIVSAMPVAAYADVIRLANGQAISGRIQSCQEGEIVVAPPAAVPVLVKIADVASGEGADIERCLGASKPAAEAVGRRWYGGQILLAELTSLALVYGAARFDNASLAVVGTGGVFLSPALVHGIHGNWGRAAGSAGIHIGMGLAGAFLGAELASGPADEEGLRVLGGAAVGVLVSQVVATTIDAASFAYEDVPESRLSVGVLLREPARSARRAPAGFALSVRF